MIEGKRAASVRHGNEAKRDTPRVPSQNQASIGRQLREFDAQLNEYSPWRGDLACEQQYLTLRKAGGENRLSFAIRANQETIQSAEEEIAYGSPFMGNYLDETPLPPGQQALEEQRVAALERKIAACRAELVELRPIAQHWQTERQMLAARFPAAKPAEDRDALWDL